MTPQRKGVSSDQERGQACKQCKAPDDSWTRRTEVATVLLDSFCLLSIAQKKKFLCAIIGDPLAQKLFSNLDVHYNHMES